ncbi:MAG: hypothetical protein ACREM3_21730 [Candidatus Rokuibacteriota bacterium]
MTCPTCANPMTAYPDDWQVCLACAVFHRAPMTAPFDPAPRSDEYHCAERQAELAGREPVGTRHP